MILWTSISRTDYYQQGHWYSKINAFSKDPTEPFNCPTGYEIANFPLMHAVHELLECKNIPFRSMTWNTYDMESPISMLYQKTLDKIERWNFNQNKKFIKTYKTEIGPWNTFETMYNTMKGVDWPPLEDILQDDYSNLPRNIQDEIDIFKKMLDLENQQQFHEQTKVDNHPLPGEHLRIAQKICPAINIKQTTIDLVNTIEKNILTEQPFSFQPKIPKIRTQI
jgi:hypothetical protein